MGARRRARLLTLGLVTVLVLIVAGVTPAHAASTLGIAKSASVTTAQPGDEFRYTIVPQCSGLTEACENARFVDVLPPEVEVTALPPSNTDRTVSYDPATRRLEIVYRIPLPAPSPPGSVGLPAGSSNNVEIGVRLPDDTSVTDGTVIPNTATVTADNAPTASDRADVTVEVPRVVRPVGTKAWSDGSAVAGTGEESTITLGVRNASSSTAQVSSLTVEDASPATFERFTVTGIGPVIFPPGADRVIVLACTEILSDCAPGDYSATAPQTGPALTLPAGIDAEDVTGLRFVFTNAAGTVIPTSPDFGSVGIDLVLRDTLRSTGDTYSPTSRDDVVNCASPSGDVPVLGTVSGSPVCATYAVQPAQATMSLDKTFFADSNADYQANERPPNNQAVDGESSLVSGLVTATNTSPFPVAEITVSEPSTTARGEWDKFDVSNTRLVFPAGATRAEVQFDCAGTVIARTFSPPPSTVDAPVPCESGRADGILATFSGLDADGNGAIRPGSTATLGIQGRLNGNVTAEDLVGGGSAGVQNCASGTATSSINGVGSAAADCASVAVQPAFSRVQGVKSSELPTILPGLPRTFSLSFTNNGTVPAEGVTLLDPVDPTAPGNAFRSIRLESLTLPATPAATVQVYDPDANDYVPYDASDSALLERALGFRIQLTGDLAPGQRYAATARVLLRDGVDAGARIQNCASVGSDSQPATNFCSAAITATEPSEGASVQKAITPATSVRPQPGLPGQIVQVKLAAQNTGTLWLKRLVVTDVDPDFFDAVDVTGTVRVNFPPSANRVRVDVCTTGCATGDFIAGTRTASQTPTIPTGVDPADVRGFRITFSVADDSFTIKPGANFPVRGACTGASVCIDVRPRATLHSDPATDTDPGTAVPATLSDSASGGYETTRQAPGQLADIPSSTATHELTNGTAALRFDKSADTSAQPGTAIPFTLTLTNSGTGPLPDPEIVDPLPAGLEFTPTNPAAPYTYLITQPAGAPDASEPTFAATQDDNGRVTALRWRFPGLELLPGGSVSVAFTAQLAPGVSAGDTVLNRAGATAARDDVGCSEGGRRPGTALNDDAYGDGLFCTSASQVTTLAGNAIRTEKWVAGDTSLGWMNSITGDLFPIDDPACPRLEVAGQSFTRYPCVARVAPGQGFDFYLRLTNAGTNPATEIRVVDVFPHSGDTGVILTGEDRGTQWQAPPTLLSDVTLTGSGVLAIGYSPDTTPCTTTLDRPPTACPDGSWADVRDSSTAAFSAGITFDGSGLRPGRSTAMRFRMAAPPAPPEPSQDIIAWNSFAHTEFFSDNGRPVQLPATEPIKTGVALVFGDLRVRKVVVDSPATGPFGFTYRCALRPEGPGGQPAAPVEVAAGEFTLGAAESVTLTALPARATCAVWENDGAGLIGDADGEANAKTADISFGGEAEIPVVTITNRAAPSPSPTPTPTDPSPSPTPTPTDPSPSPTPTPTEPSYSPSPSASPSSSPAPSGTATGTTPSGDDDGGNSDPGGDDNSGDDGSGDDSSGDGFLSQTGASTAVTVVGAIAGLLVLAGIATLGVSIRRRRL